MDIRFLISLLTLIPVSLCSWSNWSRWSACTHTCGGGIAHRTRRCLSENRSECIGEDVKYRVCRLKACPDGTPSFREEQCTAYNDIPYGDLLYTWIPDTDNNHPCQLKCKAKDHDISLILADQVQDGTRCREKSRAVCFRGSCTPVGCDYLIGSEKKRDSCGVCGGDDSTCSSRIIDQSAVENDQILPVTYSSESDESDNKQEDQQSQNDIVHNLDSKRARAGHFDYQNDDERWGDEVLTFDDIPTHLWQETEFSKCSVACGQGVERTSIVCKNVRTREIVDDQNCAGARKPLHRERVCDTGKSCSGAVRWNVYTYGECSHRCGGGTMQRQVDCVVDVGQEGQVDRVPDALCRSIGLEAPSRTKLCNQVVCPPVWVEGQWSACSATCGQGYLTRQVLCKRVIPPSREVEIMQDQFCQGEKPVDRRPCTAEKTCYKAVKINPDYSHYIQLLPRERIRLVAGGTAVVIPGAVLRVRCPVTNFPREEIMWKRGDVVIGRKGRVKKSRRGILHIREAETRDQGIYTCQADSLSATFTLRFHSKNDAENKYTKREELRVKNQQFLLRFKQQKNQDGNRKEEFTEPYIRKYFDLYNLPFNFVTSDWGACSRSCGGAGLQSRSVTCELNFGQYCLVYADDTCFDIGLDRPLSTQDCGFEQCPVWETGQYQQCSDNYCLGPGTGSRVRPLYCIAPNNRSQVPFSMCDENRRPEDKLPCAKETCEPTWIESDWTQCSRTCGGPGFRTRSLLCVWVPNKRPANGHCNGLIKPDVIKPCDTPACPTNTECRDESTYCSLVEMLNLCRYPEYRTKCCRSCNIAINRYRLRH